MHLLESFFPLETLCVSNHAACRFAGKTQSSRSLWAGRGCAAASRPAFFNGKTLYAVALARVIQRRALAPTSMRTLVSKPSVSKLSRLSM